MYILKQKVIMDLKFDYDDILIQPATVTHIDSRSEINIYDENGMLPIFASPMLDVVDKDNIDIFFANKIYGMYPRTNWNKQYFFNGSGLKFSAHSMDEFDYWFLKNEMKTPTASVLIDIANGHMSRLVSLILESKKKYGNRLTLMVGNIANPETYRILSDAGADYIRLGIGNGSGCLTTENSSVGYPMASLIKETYAIKCKTINPAKIIADGGAKKYADIIKALALGADYVMLGGILNKALESAAPNLCSKTEDALELPYDKALEHFNADMPIYKRFRGMSTKSVQRELGSDAPKTSEGITIYTQVEYTIGGWTENLEHYLKSAMSYTDKRSLSEFIGKVDYNLITNNAFRRYNK